MSRTLRLLIVEDSDDDACLILWELERGGDKIESRRVETAGELATAMDSARWDAVISDYRMPRFSGTAALAQVRARDPHIPFILVSATIEARIAAEALRGGANDCIMKQDLRRLPEALARAIAAYQARGSTP